MSAWVTDRLPEAKDATWSGYVIVSDLHGVCNRHRSDVTLGTPWQPYPEPYAMPKVWGWGVHAGNYCITYNGVGCAWFLHETRPKIGAKELQAMTDALNKLEETP